MDRQLSKQTCTFLSYVEEEAQRLQASVRSMKLHLLKEEKKTDTTAKQISWFKSELESLLIKALDEHGWTRTTRALPPAPESLSVQMTYQHTDGSVTSGSGPSELAALLHVWGRVAKKMESDTSQNIDVGDPVVLRSICPSPAPEARHDWAQLRADPMFKEPVIVASKFTDESGCTYIRVQGCTRRNWPIELFGHAYT